MVHIHYKTVCKLLIKKEKHFYSPEMVLLVIYPNESKTYVYTNCRRMVVPSSVIVKTWEQPRCSSVSELINRGASQTVEYYSAPKGNEL